MKSIKCKKVEEIHIVRCSREGRERDVVLVVQLDLLELQTLTPRLSRWKCPIFFTARPITIVGKCHDVPEFLKYSLHRGVPRSGVWEGPRTK